jgi:uncharacterized protein (DUF58 family)
MKGSEMARIELRNPGAKEGVIIDFDGTNVSFLLASDESELVTLAASSGAVTAIADLTENSGAIGGTNDGDLPDLTTPSAALNAAAARELATRVNEIQAALRTVGILAT